MNIWNDICCLRLMYCVKYEPFCFITFFHFLRNLIISSFQNCCCLLAKYFSRYVFISLQIGIVYGKNFWMTGTSNSRIQQDLRSTKDTIKHLNQTINATCDFALSWWKTTPHRFANSGHFSAMGIFNLLNWLQYLVELMEFLEKETYI